MTNLTSDLNEEELLRKKLMILKKVRNPHFNSSIEEHPETNPQFIDTVVASPKYMKYLEYKALFDEVNNKLTDLKRRVDLQDSEAMSEMNISGASYSRRSNDAEKRWRVLGYKEDVERIININDEV